MTPLARTILPIAALLCALLAGQLGSAARSSFDAAAQDEDRYHLPPPAWLRVFSLGYSEVAADLLWTKAIVYFGGQRAKPPATASGKASRLLSRARFTERYVSSVVDLDPRFRRAYVAGSRLILYHDRTITEESVRASIRLLERGAAVFPDDGEIAFSLGFQHYYELARVLEDREERRRAREAGARMLRRAASLRSAPPYAALLGARLLGREGLDDLVIEHLRAMLVRETDPGIRASLFEQLKRQAAGAAARDAEALGALYEDWRRELGFIDFGLYLVLVGEDAPTAAEAIDPLIPADRRLGLFDDPPASPEAE
jgi:hypothetical protein